MLKRLRKKKKERLQKPDTYEEEGVKANEEK